MNCAAIIIFYTRSGSVLLHNRAHIRKSDEDWGFIGGGVEKRETPEAAARREAKEELGIDPRELIALGRYQGPVNNDPAGFIHAFISPVDSEKMQCLEKGVLYWVHPKDALKLKIFPVMPRMLKDFERKWRQLHYW